MVIQSIIHEQELCGKYSNPSCVTEPVAPTATS